MKIYIATHKEFNPPKDDIYVPILVGANKNKIDVKSESYDRYIKDNSGENISDKNANYCELTGMYWIWKNDKSNTLGLVHYRRYFTKIISRRVLSRVEIESFLNKADIILPKPYYLRKNNVWTDYACRHSEEELMMCKKIISSKYPEYENAFDKVFQDKKFYTFNMFITSKYYYDQYCEWLFDILLQIENQINLEGRDNYNQRMYGFLSERLFNVWIMQNNLVVKEVMVQNTENSNTLECFKNFFKKILYYGG